MINLLVSLKLNKQSPSSSEPTRVVIGEKQLQWKIQTSKWSKLAHSLSNGELRTRAIDSAWPAASHNSAGCNQIFIIQHCWDALVYKLPYLPKHAQTFPKGFGQSFTSYSRKWWISRTGSSALATMLNRKCTIVRHEERLSNDSYNIK